MNSDICRILSHFPGTEEASYSACSKDARKSSQFAQHNLHKYPFLDITVHSCGAFN